MLSPNFVRNLLRFTKELRNQYIQAKQRAKKSYFESIVEDLKDSRQLWRKLNNLGINIKNKDKYISVDSNILNELFSQAPTDIDTNVKHETISKLANNSKICKNDMFYFTCVSPVEVHQAINEIKSSVIGPDGICM